MRRVGRMAAMMARMMMRRRRRRRRRRVLLAGGLIAFGAYKISQKDVDRVEQSTGKKAEELTDEEVEKAMDDLNIEKQEMTDAEFDQVDKADAAEDDYIKELERLSELHDNGVLTDEEFEAKKKQLLDI